MGDQGGAYGEFNRQQQLLLSILPRIVSAISLLSSLYVVINVMRYPFYRARIYNRIMLGLSLDMIVMSIWQLYGMAAVPEGTPYTAGARGTAATCSAQGFVFQYFGFSVPSYYFALSLYCFVSVKNNFSPTKYRWIERWIHIGVHVFPLVSASYLLSVDAFNFSGTSGCWIEGVPLGCGKGSGVACIRGPQNIQQLKWIFAFLPLAILLVGPTIVMAAVYCEVRKHQLRVLVSAKSVAKQASLYLLALYFSYFFAVIDAVFISIRGEHVYVISLLSSTFEHGIGFYFMLIYVRFRQRPEEDLETSKIFESSIKSEGGRLSNHREPPVITTNDDDTSRVLSRKKTEELKCTFSIFDGTNANGGSWAAFIFEGGSEDVEDDLQESHMWNEVIQR